MNILAFSRWLPVRNSHIYRVRKGNWINLRILQMGKITFWILRSISQIIIKVQIINAFKI
jgi:hypothetical protein